MIEITSYKLHYGEMIEILIDELQKRIQTDIDNLGLPTLNTTSAELLLMLIKRLEGKDIVGLVYKSLSANVMPYVVEVDTMTGAIRNVGTVEASANYQVGEAVYKYFLSKFLKNTREIPLDPVVYKENLTTSYGFLTKDAALKLQTMLKTEKTTEKFGHQTVQINISTILPMEGGHSYQIRWTEETFTIGNGEKKVTPYSGIFTVQTIRSDDDEQLAINPIGLYISDFSWSKDASAVNMESTTNINKK